MKNVAVLVAIGVDQEGYRQVLRVCEEMKENVESWRSLLRYLKVRGLKGMQLVTSDKCLGLVESLAEFYPEAGWQLCMVHWYRDVASSAPTTKVKEVMVMLKAIHAPVSIVREFARTTRWEQIVREIRMRTRVVGAFPEGNCALMLVAARLRHISGTKRGTRKYLDMSRLQDQQRKP